METVNDLKYALALLRDKRILVTSDAKSKTLILMCESKIIVKNDNATYTISEKDFLELFKNAEFAIYTQDTFDAITANEKDGEYYSWKHK